MNPSSSDWHILILKNYPMEAAVKESSTNDITRRLLTDRQTGRQTDRWTGRQEHLLSQADTLTLTVMP